MGSQVKKKKNKASPKVKVLQISHAFRKSIQSFKLIVPQMQECQTFQATQIFNFSDII